MRKANIRKRSVLFFHIESKELFNNVKTIDDVMFTFSKAFKSYRNIEIIQIELELS